MQAATRADAGIDFVEEFASAAEWFSDALLRAPLKGPVPGCPGWTVLDLATHLGNIHAWAATIVETGRPAEVLADRPGSGRSRKVAAWYLAKAEDLYSVLREAPEDRPCWNFAEGAGVAGFWQRRQTHETLLHGADLAAASGVGERLPAGLAADGVDEVLTVFLRRMHARGLPADLVAPLVLRAVDVERSWVVEPAGRERLPGGVTGGVPAQPDSSEGRAASVARRDRPGCEGGWPRVTQGERDGVDRVEAPAAVLLKLLWKRCAPEDAAAQVTGDGGSAVQVTGDRGRVLRFLAGPLTP
jgi:uncharacterized protein (TIGR03083 family)